MGAENNLGEVLSQLAIKDAGPIAELTPEQSKLVNTERCFPAIDAIVKFAQDNHTRHLEKTPDDHINNYSSKNALQFSLEAWKKIETTGVARIHGIVVGKRKLLDQSPYALTRQADGGSDTQQMIDVSPTKDLDEAYKKWQIASPSSEAARYLDYPESTLSNPTNYDLLVAVKKALKDGYKGVSIRDPGNSGWTIISQNENLPNTLCFVITNEKRVSVDTQSGSVSVVHEQDLRYDLACFSDAEWERAQLAVDKPDYAARYTYLQSKLTKNDSGEHALRGVEDNMKVLVNGVPTSFGGERSLKDEKLPAIVSAPEGKFIAWRNPARAGKIELIPTTSKELVERVILANGDPIAAIKRLQELDNSDTVVREEMKPKSEAEATSQLQLKTLVDQLKYITLNSGDFQISVPTSTGSGNRVARINNIALNAQGEIAVSMAYRRSTGEWVNILSIAGDYPGPMINQLRNIFPAFGQNKILFV